MNKKVRNVLRLIYGILLIPVVLIIGPLYKLTRYLTSRKKTSVVFEDIVAGFTNYAFPSEQVERLARTRAEICAGCPFVKYNGAINTISSGETITQVKGMYCDACGCGLSAKIRSPKNFCPKGKW